MYGSAADYFIYIGFLGLVIVSVSFLVFLFKRIAWIFGIIFGMSVGSPNYKSGTIKFLVLISFLVVIGIFTYANFYSRAYAKYDTQKVGAEVFLYYTSGDNSSISINIPRDEKYKTTQGASMPNGPYLLIGETLTVPDWMKPFGAEDGFRFYGLIKGVFTSDYYYRPIDINVSEKPNDFVWKILFAVHDFIPIAEIERHYVQFSADGYNSNFNIYVTKDGFKRD